MLTGCNGVEEVTENGDEEIKQNAISKVDEFIKYENENDITGLENILASDFRFSGDYENLNKEEYINNVKESTNEYNWNTKEELIDKKSDSFVIVYCLLESSDTSAEDIFARFDLEKKNGTWYIVKFIV